ncbi:hypothetical protein E4T56_gene18052 [Termitomyces sp. T112]|nr:hypothetical protein E4T56_gene18052 [Termitomyces sp. T112]
MSTSLHRVYLVDTFLPIMRFSSFHVNESQYLSWQPRKVSFFLFDRHSDLPTRWCLPHTLCETLSKYTATKNTSFVQMTSQDGLSHTVLGLVFFVQAHKGPVIVHLSEPPNLCTSHVFSANHSQAT